ICCLLPGVGCPPDSTRCDCTHWELVSQSPVLTINTGLCTEGMMSLFLIPAFTISALPGPCIHYIRFPRTLHFTISGLPRLCIHYIWSPRTLHSLYLVSPDPAFTISVLPEPCIHYIWSPRTLHSLYLVT
ncbi:unnamed protein product, partial [Staurois parvus]